MYAKKSPLIITFVIVLFPILILPFVKARCVNKAVYDECRLQGDLMKAACSPIDLVCQCNSYRAINMCFLQCTDDVDIVNEAKAYKFTLDRICPTPNTILPTRSISPQTIIKSVVTPSAGVTSNSNLGVTFTRKFWLASVLVISIFMF
ncbi:17088_t:CDS:2 [Acaulospora morrowiae]|uniref:17088_t:CDS:1 n=1 Tax=Acaulospora morrowiae TaxID=94023 RepID=A0A9N8WJW5_9GLOM|nr:17088_t:CDS:2 [Acaulospora morrowiae]